MKTLLQLNSSIYSNDGMSSRLADEFVAGWHAAHPGARVITRDLARDPLPHLTDERFAAFLAKPGERTADQQAVVDESDALIAELRAAEVIVIGLPFYNFGIPSTLKAYFDHIARAGVTFKYTENGAVGLLGGKRVYAFAARGGVYAGTAGDTQTPYVKQMLGFLGMDDIEFLYAEGMALGEASAAQAMAQARARIEALTQEAWRAAA